MFKFSVPSSNMVIMVVSGLVASFGLLAPAGMAQATAHAVVVNEAAAANASSAEPSGEATQAKAPVKVYCTGRTPSGDASVTGSIIKRKVCKTREQWLAEGVKIEEN